MEYTNIDLKVLFKAQFEDWCERHPLFLAMQRIVENSPWHRESNVLVHTQMVVDQYIELAPKTWSRFDYLGAVACAFHDVGKPACRTEKHSESRGVYYAYHGHELRSARMFEDFAVHLHPMFKAEEIFIVSWMIEKHLPWDIKNNEKMAQIVYTSMLFDPQVYLNVLIADQMGRIADDAATKLASVHQWIESFNKMGDTLPPIDKLMNSSNPTVVMAIGPSGCGKSSASSSLDQPTTKVSIFSLDALRHEWYSADYATAFRQSCDDSTFGARANARYIEMLKANVGSDRNIIYVDNTNRSAKSRRFYLTEARRHHFNTIAIVFPVTIDELIKRQSTRGDKCVPDDVVRQQYYSIQLPCMGEFDLVLSSTSNLK